MLFRAFMFIVTMLVPLIMIIFGARFEKKVPKEINAVFGYRTTMSMKNKETWQFAHKYIGKLWKMCGWLVLLISAVVIIVSCGKDIAAVSIIGDNLYSADNCNVMHHYSHRNCTQKEL